MLMSNAPVQDTIDDLEQLRAVYKPAHERALQKDIGIIDEVAETFISRSPLVMVATASAEGLPDVSPRGGEPGFVKTIGTHLIAIPDQRGNNRLDNITNIIEQGHAGLIFMVPGRTETLRANGKAWVTTDPEVLELFTETKRTTAAIVVEVQELYSHCAKSLMRSKVWEPETWEPDLAPTGPEMIVAHIPDVGYTVEEIAEDYDERFAEQLATELDV